MKLAAIVVTVAVAGLASGACKSKDEKTETPPTTEPQPPAPVEPDVVEVDKTLLAAYQPLPETMAGEVPLDDALVDLGRMLYYDTRLSKNHDVSCNTCHVLDEYGVDGKPVSAGHKAQTGARNSPTVYNAAGHIAQFWDGRAADVEEQAKGPVLNPVEMGMPDETYVLRVLRSIPGYVEAFGEAFPDAKAPVTFDNMATAIGAFERKLVTPSRWDQYLQGKDDALTAAEKKGFLTFSTSGCPTCHTGAYLGGHMYQKLGLVKPWPDQDDLGRFEVTKNEADKMMFKVPSLRNIEKTGPYFHDGSVATLGEAITKMADHQLGKQLTAEEVASIETFLHALTGELPTEYIARPELPESGPKTPAPDPS